MKEFILKLKGHIYRYTGIYLANKEELEFLTSDKFWKQFSKHSKSKKQNKMTNQEIQGLILGLWQFDNGFYRLSNSFFYKSGLHNKIMSLITGAYKAFLLDLKILFKRKKRSKK